MESTTAQQQRQLRRLSQSSSLLSEEEHKNLFRSLRDNLAFELQRDRPLLEKSLLAFSEAAWPIVESKPFRSNWHLEVICEYLQEVAAGKIKRLIINVPPRTGKSKLVSVMFPCWSWTCNPEARWFCSSYGGTLSEQHGLERRQIIESRWYEEMWGDKFQVTRRIIEDFRNSANGTMIATSVGGSGTGRGGNYLLADDILAVEQGFSDADRNKANRYYDQTFSNRADDWKTAAIVIIMQRLHEDDVVGHVQKNAEEGWTVLRLPMEAETRETITYPQSGRVHTREIGESLWEERFPVSMFPGMRARSGPYGWPSQYQQRPVALGGGIFKEVWWKYWGGSSGFALPDTFDLVMMSWDFTFKDKTTSDYVVGQVWGKKGADMMLLGQVRARASFSACKQALRDMKAKYPQTREYCIEDKANGTAIVDELRHEIAGLIPMEVEGGKLQRAIAITSYVESGNVYLPHESVQDVWFDYRWVHKAGGGGTGTLVPVPAGLKDYLSELSAFDRGANDDQVDATTQAIRRMTMGAGGLLNYLKTMATEKAAKPEEKPKSPWHIGAK